MKKKFYLHWIGHYPTPTFYFHVYAVALSKTRWPLSEKSCNAQLGDPFPMCPIHAKQYNDNKQSNYTIF